MIEEMVEAMKQVSVSCLEFASFMFWKVSSGSHHDNQWVFKKRPYCTNEWKRVWKVWRSLMWSLWDWSSFEETVPPAEVVVVMLLVERKEPLTSSRQCRALPSPTSSSSTNDLEIIFSPEFVTLTLIFSCQPKARRNYSTSIPLFNIMSTPLNWCF